jgi:hypothetical protein
MAFITEESDEEFYHQIANLALLMAEGIFRVAVIGVGKIILWPPMQFYLRERWNWTSNGKSPHFLF